MKPGIDVSKWNQGAVGIDWAAVAAHLMSIDPEAFVVVKATEGLSYVSPAFHQQRQGAHAAGIRNVGCYHFGRPSQASGHEEAAFFLKTIGDDGGILKGEFLCLDIEDIDVPAKADLAAYCVDFLETVYQALGIRPFLYSGKWFTSEHHLERHPELAVYPLWWASYTDTMPAPVASWAKILVWQYSANGQVPGIQGPVDLDWLNGTIDDLRPYQWGFAPNPLAGQPVDPPPDINVPSNSESVTDAGTVARKIGEDALALANLLSDAELKRRAMVIKSDADLIVKITWNH